MSVTDIIVYALIKHFCLVIRICNNFFGHDEVIERMIDAIAQSDTSEMVVIAVASVKTPKVLKL